LKRRLRVEDDHAANPALRLHQLEAAVHLGEPQAVGDQRVDVELAAEPAVDELRYAVAALDAAERRAGDAAARDEEARHDVEGLAPPRDAAHGCQSPAHAGGLDRLAHDGD